MQGDRKCVIDHKRYIYCPNCGKGKAEETWRYMFCSEGCRDIYQAIEDWATNKITPVYARKILDQNNARSIDGLRKDIFDSIQEIYKSAKVEDTSSVPKPNKEKSVEEEKVEEKPKPKKKKPGRPKKIVNED